MYTQAYNRVMRHAGLEKLASRAGQRMLRRLIDSGQHERANTLSQQMHSRAQNVPGYQPREHIQQLGSGAEGVADLISTPEGLRVLKQYNPRSGMVTDQMLDRKADLFQQAHQRGGIGGTDVATLHGQRQVGKVNPVRSFEHDYVPGVSSGKMREYAGDAEAAMRGAPSTASPAQRAAYDRRMAQRQEDMYQDGKNIIPSREADPTAHARGKGYTPADTYRNNGGENVRYNPATGKWTAMDMATYTRHENTSTLAARKPGQSVSEWLDQTDVGTLPGRDPIAGGHIDGVVQGTLTGGQQKAWMHRGVQPTVPAAKNTPARFRGTQPGSAAQVPRASQTATTQVGPSPHSAQTATTQVGPTPPRSRSPQFENPPDHLQRLLAQNNMYGG